MGQARQIIALNAKAFVAENVGNAPRKDRPLVLGNAHGAVKGGRAVAVEPHEWVHAVGIESDKPAAAPEHPPDFTGEPARIRKMMHQATQQNAIKALALERQVLGIPFDQLKAGVFPVAELYLFVADMIAAT